MVDSFGLEGANGSSSAPLGSSGAASSSSLVWEPLPLRATFRPLNRAPAGSARDRSGRSSEPVGVIRERSVRNEPAPANSDLAGGRVPFGTRDAPPAPTRSSGSLGAATATTSSSGLLDFEPEDELPTRQPMNRFRPALRPTEPAAGGSGAEPAGGSGEPGDEFGAPLASGSGASESPFAAPPQSPSGSRLAGGQRNSSLAAQAARALSGECFECICEASTSCNPQSKCQTSDVRHTRCGLFLISYDQWLATNLSRELVSREALARDPAADERAFYECVTERDCAQRLLTIYMQTHHTDCDKDGRIDCYDLAAIHHSGPEQCSAEALLDSQYWSDFNACFGFAR